MTELQKAFDKAKFDFMTHRKATFIINVFFSLKFFWDEQIPTACTNGITVRVNPKFFLSLSPKLRISLMVHEAWHVALKHMFRLKNSSSKLNAKTWNCAGDYVINQFILDMGLPIPDDWLHDWDYQGMSTDEVYKILADNSQKSGSGGTHSPKKGNGSPSLDPPMDDLELPEDVSDTDIEQIEEQIDQIIMKAANAAKMKGDIGSIPGCIEAQIGKLTNPALPWNVIFSRYMTDLAKADYSYSRPNRRYLPDMYLPSLSSSALTELVFAFDASGSVSDEELTDYISNVEYVRRTLNPQKTTIIVFDNYVRNVYTLNSNDSITKVVCHGRGGTNAKSVFDYIAKNKIKPTALVVFTDMCFPPVTEKPKYPVLWIAVNAPKNISTHFGKVIEYNKEF